MPKVRDLKRPVEAAFLGVQRDEACTLHQAQPADESLSRAITKEEWDAIALLDPETGWRDVPPTPRAVISKILYLRNRYHFGPGRWRYANAEWKLMAEPSFAEPRARHLIRQEKLPRDRLRHSRGARLR